MIIDLTPYLKWIKLGIFVIFIIYAIYYFVTNKDIKRFVEP